MFMSSVYNMFMSQTKLVVFIVKKKNKPKKNLSDITNIEPKQPL